MDMKLPLNEIDNVTFLTSQEARFNLRNGDHVEADFEYDAHLPFGFGGGTLGQSKLSADKRKRVSDEHSVRDRPSSSNG